MSDSEKETVTTSESSETSESMKLKGNDFYKSKNYSSAIASYSSAISLEPTNALLYTNRAAAYLMTLQYKEAIADCDKAISLDANNSKAFFRKATALKGLGNLVSAIEALTTGLQYDPTNSVAIQEKTLLETCQKKIAAVKMNFEKRLYSAALTGVDEVIKSIGNTNNRELNIIKVKVLIALKRNEEALNLTNVMMRMAANGDSELLGIRASCLFVMGDIDSAIKHLQQAVRADPDNTEIRSHYRLLREIDEKKNQGDECFKQGNLIEAINGWTSCINIVKDSPLFQSKLYLNRATALFKQKKHDDAIKDCTKAIYYNHNYVKAYARRAECYMAQGGEDKITRGISDLETAIELETDETVQESYKDKLKKAKVALKRSKRKDLYGVLGVTQEATEAEIKTAYKKAALKYHPDKQATKSEEEKTKAENMFKSVGEAYEILTNPEKKSRYDSGVEVEDLENPHAGHDGCGHGHGGHGGIDPNIIFQMFMQQQQGGGRGGFSF